MSQDIQKMLDKVYVYKELANMALHNINWIQSLILLELRLNVSYGYTTSEENYFQQVKDYMNNTALARYWQDEIKKIKKVVDNTK